MNDNNPANGTEEVTTQSAAVNKYRRAFKITLVACIALAMIAGGLWWRLHTKSSMVSTSASTMGRMAQPDAQTMPASGDASPQAQDSPVAPIQLSPQRMQSIGVSIGTVESKQVSDEIRFYGNVQANSAAWPMYRHGSPDGSGAYTPTLPVSSSARDSPFSRSIART